MPGGHRANPKADLERAREEAEAPASRTKTELRVIEWSLGVVASSQVLSGFYKDLQDWIQHRRAMTMGHSAERWLQRLTPSENAEGLARQRGEVEALMPAGDHTSEQERLLWMEAIKRLGALVLFYAIGVALSDLPKTNPGSSVVSRLNQYQKALGFALLGLKCAFPEEAAESILEAAWSYSRDEIEAALGEVGDDPGGAVTGPALDEAKRVLLSVARSIMAN